MARRLVVIALVSVRLAGAAVGRGDVFFALPHGPVFRSVRDFGAVGDGRHDDTAAFQAALDYERGAQYEKRPALVYVPPGVYRLSDTLVLWKFTHLVGDEEHPPTLVLAGHSPGFSDPQAPKPFLVTCNGWSIDPATHNWRACTDQQGGSINNNFFTEIRNLRLRIEPRNAGAIAVFWRVAQQTCLRAVSIEAGDAAYGIRMADWGGGGLISHVSISGGQVGLAATEFSQLNVCALRLRGQSQCAISLQGIWNFAFVDLRIEQAAAGLRARDCLGLQLIDACIAHIASGAAMEVSNTNLYVQNLRCGGVKEVVAGMLAAPGKEVTIGRWYSGWTEARAKEVAASQPPPTPPSPLPIRPRPQLTHPLCVRDFGAVGDGQTDDTAALQAAIDQAQEIFLPHGTYLVSDTLRLRAHTRLFGECFSKIYLRAGCPGFGDRSHPRPVLQTPDDPAGTVTLCDLWITAGENNPGAILVDWRVGPRSGIFDTTLYCDAGIYCQLRLRGHGGGYFSNMWNPGGVAERGEAGVQRGLWASSRGPAIFYASHFEHQAGIPYLLEGAQDYTFIIAQTEQSPVHMVLERCRRIRLFGSVFGFWQRTCPLALLVRDSEDILLSPLVAVNADVLLRVEREGREELSLPGGAGFHSTPLLWLAGKSG
jgi:hypothetical protein